MSSPVSPTVFISWAHQNSGWTPAEGAAWSDKVRSFATVLRSDGGVDVDIDLWHSSETIDWSRWGPNRISGCDRVIVILSTAWAERFEGKNEPTIGAGAAAEADELLGLYDTNQAHFRQKVLLVLLSGVSPSTIPNRLRGVNRFVIDEISVAGIEELLRYLTAQPQHLRPALGAVPVLPPATGTAQQRPDTGTSSVGVGSGDASVFETVPRSDYTARLRAASDARLRQRRRGVGLDDDAVERTLALQPVVPESLTDLPAGHLRLLTGPLGSGKSDVAEQWHRETIDRFDSTPDSPIPVWLSMRDLDEPLERAVTREIGRTHLDRIGADVVLDGLDERTDLASDAVRQATVLAARWPRSRVVLTSRATWSVSEKDVVPVEPLPLRTGLAVSRAAAGRNVPEASIDKTLFRRPLFALLAGQHAYSPDGVAGIAELIDAVVSRVVESDSYNLYDELKRLAVETIRGGGPIDPAIFATEPIANRLRKSPLTTSFGQRCAFSLATFEQWFAAKALLERDVDLDDLLVSLASFDRWKYVFASVLAAGQPERVDPIMSTLAAWNPGAASWVIRETRTSGLTRRRPVLDPGEWELVGARVRTATAAWLTGLNPMHIAFAPISSGAADRFDDTSTLIIVEPHRLLIGWLGSHEKPDHLLPPVLHDMPCNSEGKPTHSFSYRSSESP